MNRRCPRRLKYLLNIHAKLDLFIKCGTSGVRNFWKCFPTTLKLRFMYIFLKKTTINGKLVFDKRKLNKGRPRKYSRYDQCSMTWTIQKLRKIKESFTQKRLQLEAGTKHVLNRTFRRNLNSNGYKYLQTRKKGCMSESNLKMCTEFCQNLQIWT